jgi:hypothetical protein
LESQSLVETHGTDAIIPIQIRIVGHTPPVQVGNALPGGRLRATEIGILINRDGHPAVNLDGADFIVQRDLRNMGSAFTAEIIADKINILKEASSAPWPAARTSSATGTPPAGSTTLGLDAELGFATAVHPDSSPVVAPSLTANALCAAELLNQDNNGVWIAQGTILKAIASRLASNGIASSLVVLRRGSAWNEKANEEGRKQK